MVEYRHRLKTMRKKEELNLNPFYGVQDFSKVCPVQQAISSNFAGREGIEPSMQGFGVLAVPSTRPILKITFGRLSKVYY